MITFKIMFSFQALEFVFIGSKSVWSYFSHACDYILKTDNQAVHQEPLSPKGRLRTCCCRWVLPRISKEGMTGWAQESMEPNTLMVRAWRMVLPQLRRFCCCLSAAIGQRSQEHWPRIQTLHREPRRGFAPQGCRRWGLQVNKGLLACGISFLSKHLQEHIFLLKKCHQRPGSLQRLLNME